jgi:Mce-associated membrane protein
MIFRERRKPASEADASVDPDDPPGETALALAEAAEAEAAEVEARAAAARARATRLRHQAGDAQPESGDDTATTTADESVAAPETKANRARRRWLQRPTSKAMGVGAAIMLMCGSFAASGYIAWQHRISAQKRESAAEFAAAARRDVGALMSLDFNKSKEDMQRIVDNSTGTFKQHFPVIAQQLTQGLERSKIVTTVEVTDVAVESMSGNSAVVLVAATTRAKEADGPQEPRTWHIAVSLLRDGGPPKMSNVEFVQ